jgi:hypothetical protein
MPLKLFLLLSVACILVGCSSFSKLTIAFKEGDDFYKGIKIELKKQKIGYVSSVKIYKEGILLKIKLDDKIKIPVGSQFIMYEALVGNPSIEVLLSDNKIFLSSKDTVQGIFKTIRVGQ